MSESAEIINRQLRNIYGIDTETTMPMWRVVFTEDQFEKRMMTHTNEGWPLLSPEMRVVKKYGGWIKAKWVLECLVNVPEHQQDELCGLKKSYECLFVFQDKNDNFLPPNFQVAEIVINLVNMAKGNPDTLTKYKENPEQGKIELENMMEQLYGEGTDVADALHHGEGIVVPSNYEKN